jgi:uncharacterized HAD superfamily protein
MSFTRFKKLLHNRKETIIEDNIIFDDVSVEEIMEEFNSENLAQSESFSEEDISSIEEIILKIKKMTKIELDEYAEKYEIQLDRRKTKNNMIEEFIQKLKEKN